MGGMSTAVVVAVVVVLMLLGIGMVTSQLLRLKRYLSNSPPDAASGEGPSEPPEGAPR